MAPTKLRDILKRVRNLRDILHRIITKIEEKIEEIDNGKEI